MTTKFHLAQLNIARMLAPIDDPLMASFSAQLDRINALAEQSPGFVWRLQTEDGDATTIQAFEDPLILVNMSVWESRESLHHYVYNSDHMKLLRNRREWFQPLEGPGLVLWWVAAGHQPDTEEAKQRLQLLSTQGPSVDAFSFGKHFPPPDDPS
jgi:hypothetical protein